MNLCYFCPAQPAKKRRASGGAGADLDGFVRMWIVE